MKITITNTACPMWRVWAWWWPRPIMGYYN